MVVIRGVATTPDFSHADQYVSVQVTFPTPFIDDNIMVSLSCNAGWVAFSLDSISKNGFVISCRNEANGPLYRRGILWQAMGYTE